MHLALGPVESLSQVALKPLCASLLGMTITITTGPHTCRRPPEAGAGGAVEATPTLQTITATKTTMITTDTTTTTTGVATTTPTMVTTITK